jgi:N-methylhydantoinase A
MSYLVGVDIGGTFTDGAAIDGETGAVHSAKTRTTPDDLGEGVVAVIELLAEAVGLSVPELLARTDKFAHGTTQTSNVMFTWSGARTGLLSTRGFGDELLIMRARGRVAGLGLSERRHFRTTEKPHQIVPRHLIDEVSERMDHHGHPIVPLRREEAERAVDHLVALGVEAVAICLLWAHENPAHEQLLVDVLHERAPHVFASASHQIAPVLGEYERTATTAVNAYVGPIVEGYLRGLDKRLSSVGLREPILVVQSNGGVVRADQATPVSTIESGPVAGMVAVREVAESTGHPQVIATDVGGTTFKVGLLVDGEWMHANETIVNQYTLLVPMVDIVSIGAGGGSIAWVDDTRLRVGPESAGADPGPVCYGLGATAPTVTDADLVLGFLDPEGFLGGRLRLDRESAEAAIRTEVADKLFEGDVGSAAAGIRAVVDAQMAGLVRRMTIERGFDPRDFVLMSYGGAGPLHAASYARGLGISEIVIPLVATVYSAYGAATSDIQVSVQRSVSSSVQDDSAAIESILAELEREARSLLSEQVVEAGTVEIKAWAEMRYERQLHDVRVNLQAVTPGVSLLDGASREFERRYASLYGEGAILADTPTRFLRVGVEAIAPSGHRNALPATLDSSDATAAEVGSRQVFWPEARGWVPTRVYDGGRLKPGNAVI